MYGSFNHYSHLILVSFTPSIPPALMNMDDSRGGRLAAQWTTAAAQCALHTQPTLVDALPPLAVVGASALAPPGATVALCVPSTRTARLGYGNRSASL